MSATRRRREAILALLASRSIHSQAELAGTLRDLGFRASQASLSRDIAALGLVKAGGCWRRPPTLVDPADPLQERLRGQVLAVREAGDHLLVLTTPPGEAPGVALALDRLAWPGVVGTLAGDDTIFIALDGKPGQIRVRRRLEGLRQGA